MGRRLKIHTLKCSKCGHEWHPRMNDPIVCPKCHRRWDKPKGVNNGK